VEAVDHIVRPLHLKMAVLVVLVVVVLVEMAHRLALLLREL
jgi:hypothetical protein